MILHKVRVFLSAITILVAVAAVADDLVKIDWNTPRNVLGQEAEKDNPDALFFVALHYALGAHGFLQDEAKSSEFFQKGAKFADQESPAA